MSETQKKSIHSHHRQTPQNGSFKFSENNIRIPAGSEYLKHYRKNSWTLFNDLSFPTRKDEAWRRTNLSDFKPGDFSLSPAPAQINGGHAEQKAILNREAKSYSGQIIQTNDYTYVHMNDVIETDGVIFTDLKTAEERYPEYLEKIMGRTVEAGKNKFSALTASLAQYGALLYIPSGINTKDIFSYKIVGAGVDVTYLSHIMVFLEDNSSATFIIEESSPTKQDGYSVNSSIIEIFVGKNANLSIIKLQNWGEHVWNFSNEKAIISEDGHIDWMVGALGSHLTKSFIDLELIEKNSSGKMLGFYIPYKNQHFDYDTQQNHLAPNTTSDLTYKGALLGNSRCVWQGMIYVSHNAIKTDGYQINRNLMLSPTARADSIPGLEILANDVRCTHGSTIGKIDEEQMFYLLSRGISKKEAEKLIIDGFFDPIIQNIYIDSIRDRYKKLIDEKLGF